MSDYEYLTKQLQDIAEQLASKTLNQEERSKLESKALYYEEALHNLG